MVGILEILQSQAEATATLLDIFTSGYQESYRKMRGLNLHKPKTFKTDWVAEYHSRQKFYTLLNKLKREGFIEKHKNGKTMLWKITKDGLAKLGILNKLKYFSLSNIDYEKINDGKVRIITFDIPEKERRKRDWLRAALTSLKYSLLQQSVWIGKTKIPEKFLNDLREKQIISYIHIFEISRGGTIKKI